MGCGNGKVLPDASVKGCVGVVQWLVAFGRATDQHQHHDDEPKKKQRSQWFSAAAKNPPPGWSVQLQEVTDRRRQDKAAKYKDTFDPRVTAR